MAKPVFNWASVAKGKPQLTADVEHAKEKERLAKAEQERQMREIEKQRISSRTSPAPTPKVAQQGFFSPTAEEPKKSILNSELVVSSTQ